jgi:Glutamate/Leucine/Phenylalanine/Valine dehydrogenase
VGLPAALGGIPLDELGATGWGIRHAAEVAAPHCRLALEGARVVVQGFGAVGRHAARFLVERGAILVAASDSRRAIHNPKGLDIDDLIALKDTGKAVGDYRDRQMLDPGAVLDVDCDIWIPAARRDVVREDNVHRLKTKLVLEGANIPLTPGAERALHEKGVLVVPDFNRERGRGDLRRDGVPRGNPGGRVCGDRREDPNEHGCDARHDDGRRDRAAPGRREPGDDGAEGSDGVSAFLGPLRSRRIAAPSRPRHKIEASRTSEP